MAITPEQAHLSLPTGLSAEDYTLGGGSLLDYTPPNVQWQAPLVPLGENVFENYAKTQVDRSAAHQPRLLTEYNRRLSRPAGTTGALPITSSGHPMSLASFGKMHWDEFGVGDPDTQLSAVPGALYPYSPSGGTRNPYIGYSGGVAGGIGTGGGPLSATGGVPSGMELAYPVWSYYGDYPNTDQDEYYQAGSALAPHRQYYTQETELPYFQYAPGDPSTLYEGNQQLRVGQAYVPTGDYSGVFSF